MKKNEEKILNIAMTHLESLFASIRLIYNFFIIYFKIIFPTHSRANQVQVSANYKDNSSISKSVTVEETGIWIGIDCIDYLYNDFKPAVEAYGVKNNCKRDFIVSAAI